MLQLFTHHRSVSAHRVRIALNHKGITYKSIYMDLDRTSVDRLGYLDLNPQGLIPALVLEDNKVVTQSSAILEYLEERYPERPLLPEDIGLRARIRSFAQIAIADTHTLNNLRVLLYLRDEMGVEFDLRRKWFEHWLERAFTPMESILSGNNESGTFCFGEKPSLADVCLVPQVSLAARYDVDLTPFPTLRRIYLTCLTRSDFQSASPDNQSDLRSRSC